MTEQIRPGEMYGKRIADAFYQVSIHEGPEFFLAQFKKLDTVAGNLLAARQSLLPSHAADGEREDWDPFHELDEAFFRWFDGDAARWDKAADAYAVRADA